MANKDRAVRAVALSSNRLARLRINEASAAHQDDFQPSHQSIAIFNQK